MKWSAERYARLYTRDTPNWVAAPWQARALLPLVVRKLDRAGTLDLDDNGMDGLAAVVGLPVEIVEVGMVWWERKGTLVMVGSVLTMPNFVEAQECRQTDARRKEDSRSRPRPEATPPLPDVSGEFVTSRHQPSPAVTDGHSVPYRTVPSLAVPPVPGETREARDPGAIPVERRQTEPTGKLDNGNVSFQKKFWIEAYERAVTEERGVKAWCFPEVGFRDLRSVVETHCVGADRRDITGWIDREVRAFIRAIRETGQDPDRLWSSFAANGFLRWWNAQRPGLVQESAVVPIYRPPPIPVDLVPAEQIQATIDSFGSSLKRVAR